MTHHAKRKLLPHFDKCSVVLFTALAVGGIAGAHAQTAPDSRGAQNKAVFGGTEPSRATQAPAPTAQDVQGVFNHADSNKDGKLSPQEARVLPAVAQRFGAIDKDGDHFISRTEFEAAVSAS
jgi:EF hand domain-containing protein